MKIGRLEKRIVLISIVAIILVAIGWFSHDWLASSSRFEKVWDGDYNSRSNTDDDHWGIMTDGERIAMMAGFYFGSNYFYCYLTDQYDKVIPIHSGGAKAFMQRVNYHVVTARNKGYLPIYIQLIAGNTLLAHAKSRGLIKIGEKL